MTELKADDKVRVKPLAAIGTILRVTRSMRHTPFLVEVYGYGTRGYAAEELEKLPTGTVLDLPPAGAPVALVRGPGTSRMCGVRNCWSPIDRGVPTCTKCGATWRLP